MLRRGISFSTVNGLILVCILLFCSDKANAQRHGGGGMASGGGGISGISRPTGVDEKDSLKDFHQALALQATSQQIAEFQGLIKSTEAAQAELQAFLHQVRKENGAAETGRRDSLDHALENARMETGSSWRGSQPRKKTD